MAVGLGPLPDMRPVTGVRLGTVSAGVKTPGRRDLVVMELATGSRLAAVFTRNRFSAAPVVVAREHRQRTTPRYLLINTGNANAGTGERGLRDARDCCEALAALVGVAPEAVLPFSTGVIGEPLPVDRIRQRLPAAVAALDPAGWSEAASGILTTDTLPKGASCRLSLAGGTVTITGIAKGSGMIRPDMATMLAFIATDAALPQALLDRALTEAVRYSFNRITVDGDTSTNDACVLAATGAGAVELAVEDDDYRRFVDALSDICRTLAQAIVRDGEGATRFITVRVEGGATEAECEAVAYTIAHSPLVKTAAFAGDPNWGRILAAIGRAGVDALDVTGVRIWLDDYLIAEGGGRAEGYQESEAAARMAQDDVVVRVDLGRGAAEATVWTSDLSYEYVRINAEYRS
ncbi:MAG: bifunctional glutamate N-acetyltransferase/amino-acid acetyltransferase ArgJ [Ectothiorhodospiraceae bacterium]|nr:bifunctional glutamate N-acetyltransferase/amino-acid acetyltransferase ArgJ [Ectothiorhodospiraceae bacterium]